MDFPAGLATLAASPSSGTPLDRQLPLFGEPRRDAPVRRAGGRPRFRRHQPKAGEVGVPLTEVQRDLVDWALDALAADEALLGHAIPVRVDEVLHLPRDLEVVGALMDTLDERLESSAAWLPGEAGEEGRRTWKRSADNLAQKVHEWWLEREG
jgi:hypothetical protein